MPPGTDPPTARPRVAVLAVRREATAREDHRSLEEMIFAVARDTLADAGLTQATVDGIVLSGNDQSDGRVISCMTSAGPAGGVDKDVTMIASSGEHALVYGWLRLRSGQGDTVLVIGWGKPSEGLDPDFAELVSAEPYVLRAIGMNDTIAAALQASRWADPAAATTTATVSWPLTADDLPQRGDAVVAAVLAVDGTFAPGRELAWIRGAGWSTENYELGARDVGAQTALDQALAHLARGVDPAPAAGWDSVEIAAPSEPAAARAAGKLGLPAHATVNGAGSLHERLAPAHIAGLDRLLAAAGSVGSGPGVPGTAAGVGFNGFAGQGATVMVFGAPGTREGAA